jgi:hypothetical protein
MSEQKESIGIGQLIEELGIATPFNENKEELKNDNKEGDVIMTIHEQVTEKVSEERLRPTIDAGALAADKMRKRTAAQTAATYFRRTVYFFLTVLLMVIGLIVWYGYENKVTGRFIDDRSCEFSIGNREMTGIRTYSYPYTEIFGFRFIDTSTIEEKTTINIRGDAMTVVGHSSTGWWAINIGTGEIGKQVIKNAESYTFVMGKAVNVIPYRQLCK